MIRELTKQECKEIKTLVSTMCANYDKTYHCCTILDDYGCYMLSKGFADGKLCRYFREAVLPLNPALERVLTGNGAELKPCAVCGTPFPISGRKAYCSEKCQENGKKAADAKRAKKYRQNKG